MTGGQHQAASGRALQVAGVAGGVGTSTWARVVQLAMRMPVQDLREYRGGRVDMLVTSTTAAAAARLGPALAACPRPPLLVVMHTVPGVIAQSRSLLRQAQPYVTARFDIAHRRDWLELADPPGQRFLARSKNRDIVDALSQLPQALTQMYAAPRPEPRPAPAPPPAARPDRLGAAEPALPTRPPGTGVATPPPGRGPGTAPRAGPVVPRWASPVGGGLAPVVHRGSALG